MIKVVIILAAIIFLGTESGKFSLNDILNYTKQETGLVKIEGSIVKSDDPVANAFQFGKTMKFVMLECKFKDNCFLNELNRVLKVECQNPENYDMLNSRECEQVFSKQMEKVYYYNKNIMGY